MERIVRIVAPTSAFDFFIKLIILVGICGVLNHVRDIIFSGFADADAFKDSLRDAAFTAFPMCAAGLLLIAHLNRLQKRLYRLATQDSLTGLYNRRAFLATTPQQIGPSQALMIIDIDHFKRINDQFGHDVGDTCLQHMARHLQAVLGSEFDVARIGGEEFAVFANKADRAVVAAAAKQIADGFEFDAGDGVMHRVTNSVGISVSPEGQTRAEALKFADQAAYAAKSRGRACFVFFNQLQQVGAMPAAS